MSDVHYTVTAKPQVGYEVKSQSANSETQAVTIAKEWAKEFSGTENGVYVSFYRASDGQSGYLNPDGNHGISGQNWVE